MPRLGIDLTTVGYDQGTRRLGEVVGAVTSYYHQEIQ